MLMYTEGIRRAVEPHVRNQDVLERVKNYFPRVKGAGDDGEPTGRSHFGHYYALCESFKRHLTGIKPLVTCVNGKTGYGQKRDMLKLRVISIDDPMDVNVNRIRKLQEYKTIPLL